MMFYIMGPANVTDSFGKVGSTASITPTMINSCKYMDFSISAYDIDMNS